MAADSLGGSKTDRAQRAPTIGRRLAEKLVNSASCGRGSESGVPVINDLPSRDRRKRRQNCLFQQSLKAGYPIALQAKLATHR